jgi:hypothetical protein
MNVKGVSNHGVVMQACNPSVWEAEAGRWRVGGQPGLQGNMREREKRERERDYTEFWLSLRFV